MFGDINKVILMGNLVKDPELRFTPSKASVLTFSLATNRSYKSGDDWKEEVSFHNVVTWRNAETLAKRMKKGTRVYVEGRSHTRSWDGDDGKKNYRTEVIVDRIILISRYSEDEHASAGSTASSTNSDDVINVDDLPF